MKQKQLIVIIALFVITAFSACGIRTKDNDIQTLKEEKIDNSIEPSVKPSVEQVEITESANVTNNKEEIGVYDQYVMTPPPFSYYKSDKVMGKEKQPIELDMILCEPNKITNDDEWFNNNNIFMNEFEVPNLFQDIVGDLPNEIDKNWNDLMITKAFYDDFYIYSTYGSDFSEGYIINIYDKVTLSLVYSLDFCNYRYSPEYIEEDYNYVQQKINWAIIRDNILYLSYGHNTYAKSSNNMNGYITAINLIDMSIIWRTDALVSNSYNFLIINDVIICGYGFTAESDYLYQVDIHTGEVLKSIPLKSSPSYILKKDNILYVRTYNTDYEYEIELELVK